MHGKYILHERVYIYYLRYILTFLLFEMYFENFPNKGTLTFISKKESMKNFFFIESNHISLLLENNK